MMLLLAVLCGGVAVGAVVDVGIVATSADLNRAAQVLVRQIQTRASSTSVSVNATGVVTISLSITPALGIESFSITGSSTAVRVAGGGPRGVLYGVGKLLRTATFTNAHSRRAPKPENGTDASGGTASTTVFAVGSWRGTDSPGGDTDGFNFRAMYLATHFENFYQAAPLATVIAYIEDLACIWGANSIVLEMPWEEFTGFADAAMLRQINTTAAILRGVQGTGLMLGFVGVANQGFTTRPDSMAACYPLPDNHFGEFNAHDPQVSVSKPGGLAYLVDNYKELFHRYKAAGVDLDIFVSWPYDEGGSACPGDWPWGSTGFLNVSHELSLAGKAIFPQMKIVLSTWGFDAPSDFGEFAGLDTYIKANPSLFDLVMADGAPNGGKSLPPWPMQHGGPGGLPLVNFPEISMAGREPWGGFGANPQPARLDGLWDVVKTLVKGGMPYSEGIFDDMNQAICFQQYWNASKTAAEIVVEYVEFEYGRDIGLVTSVTTAVALLERDYPMQTAPGPCYRVACEADEICGQALTLLQTAAPLMTAEARGAWRWKILMDRAVIDVGLNATHGQVAGDATVAAFADLTQIYWADNAYAAVKPPMPSNHTCGGSAGYSTCSLDSGRGPLIPWTRAINISNVYGTTTTGGPETPLLGLFDTESECQQACSTNANCTQYTWQAGEVCQEVDGQWRCDDSFARHCYGRCDTTSAPHIVNGSVSATRVKTATPT